MKAIALVLLYSIGLLTAQSETQTAKHEFELVIEETNYRIKVYQPSSPMVIEPMVEKNFRPKSQLMLALMLTRSDISSYMSDEEIAGLFSERPAGEEIQKLRSTMKMTFELTGPAAEDNPWKGMKYVVDQVFVIESDKGKFLLYQLSSRGGEVENGVLYGSLKQVAGRWVHGGAKGKAGLDFQKSMFSLVPKEFTKHKESTGMDVLPLEALLK